MLKFYGESMRMTLGNGVLKSAFWGEVIDRSPLFCSGQLMLPTVLARIATHSNKAGSILVLHRRKLIGTVTIREVMRAIAQTRDWQRQRLGTLITRPVVAVSLSELEAGLGAVPLILEVLTRHQLDDLPIVDEHGQLVGKITEARLLRILYSQSVSPATADLAPTRVASSLLTQNHELLRQHQCAQLLAEITLKIHQSLQLQDILQTTVNEVQRLLKADRVLIYQVLPDGTGKPISEAVVPPYPAILGMSFPEEVFPEAYQTLYAQGRVQAISDVHAPDSGLAQCLVDFIEQWGIQSKLIVPIVHPLKPEQSVGNAPLRNHLWGLLIAHQCRGPRTWSEFELELMRQLANQISLALSHGQMLEYLEERVKVRTRELTRLNQALHREIQDRKQVEAALRQSEEQLRLITNNLPVLIAYVDRQERYRFNNQAYHHWFGQTPTDIAGQSMEAVMGRPYYQTIQPHLRTALAGNQVTYESELTLKDGRAHSVSVTYIPHIEAMEDSLPQIKGFFALTTDISDRKAIERMKDEFIAVVSHELRTPLTSIHGSLKLMATGRLGQLSEAGQQMLEVADENTDRLVRLVNNVLDLQRIESGEVTMDVQICDAVDLIDHAAEAMRAIAQAYAIEIQTRAEPISIWADPDYIVQTLTNLIGNAIKFSIPGNVIHISVQPCVKSALHAERSDCGQTDYADVSPLALFCVQDQGQGIPPDKLNSIFERFQQVDSSDSRKKGGTGLGLAICRKIIEQHGGQIWAESQIGIGSQFYFTVPLSSPQSL